MGFSSDVLVAGSGAGGVRRACEPCELAPASGLAITLSGNVSFYSAAAVTTTHQLLPDPPAPSLRLGPPREEPPSDRRGTLQRRHKVARRLVRR